MKGKKEFTEHEIMGLRMLIRERVKASSSDQKRIRNAMRSIGFYGRDDWGIIDCQESDLDDLLKSGKIRITR